MRGGGNALGAKEVVLEQGTGSAETDALQPSVTGVRICLGIPIIALGCGGEPNQTGEPWGLRGSPLQVVSTLSFGATGEAGDGGSADAVVSGCATPRRGTISAAQPVRPLQTVTLRILVCAKCAPSRPWCRANPRPHSQLQRQL